MFAQGVEDGAIGIGAGRRRQHALGQRDGAEANGFAHAHGTPVAVEARFAASLDPVGQRGADVVLIDRRRRGDARILRLALQVGDDQQGLARQRIGGVEHGAGAVGQHETAALAARLGDAVRPGMDEKEPALPSPLRGGSASAPCAARRGSRGGVADGVPDPTPLASLALRGSTLPSRGRVLLASRLSQLPRGGGARRSFRCETASAAVRDRRRRRQGRVR